MMPYMFFLVFISILAVMYIMNKNKIFLFIIYITAGFFSGFRYEVGVDYNSYIRAYNDILSGFNSGYFEPGNVWLIQIIDSMGGTAQLYLLIMALATNILIYFFVIQNSKNYVISTLFYLLVSLFYTASFNAVRQYLTIAIFLYAIRFIKERKLFHYMLTIIFGSFFHLSIIITIPLYFFLRKKYNIYQYIGYGAIILVVLSHVLDLVINFLGKTIYLNFANTSSSQTMIYIFMIIIIYFIVVIKDKDPVVSIFKNLIFISFLLLTLQITNRDMSMVIIRLNSYFLFALIPLVSYIPVYNRIKVDKILYVIPIVFVAYLYFFNVILNKGVLYKLTPYQFNFNILKE